MKWGWCRWARIIRHLLLALLLKLLALLLLLLAHLELGLVALQCLDLSAQGLDRGLVLSNMAEVKSRLEQNKQLLYAAKGRHLVGERRHPSDLRLFRRQALARLPGQRIVH